jgi:hypothetical protein
MRCMFCTLTRNSESIIPGSSTYCNTVIISSHATCLDGEMYDDCRNVDIRRADV